MCSIECLGFGLPRVTPNHPKPSKLLHFALPFLIFATSERRDFKFDSWIEHSMSQPTDDKSPLKTAWSRHVTHFKFRGL